MNKAKKSAKYVIVQNIDNAQHCAQCTNLLELGYTPLGGPSVIESTKNNNSLVITQAFIIEYKKETKQ